MVRFLLTLTERKKRDKNDESFVLVRAPHKLSFADAMILLAVLATSIFIGIRIIPFLGEHFLALPSGQTSIVSAAPGNGAGETPPPSLRDGTETAKNGSPWADLLASEFALGSVLLGGTFLLFLVAALRNAPPTPLVALDEGAVHPHRAGNDALLHRTDWIALRRLSPREAVIAAYLRFVYCLADTGCSSSASHTPEERLALLQLPLHPLLREPMERLTELFEVARYSLRALTPEQRDDAVDSAEYLVRVLTVSETPSTRRDKT